MLTLGWIAPASSVREAASSPFALMLRACSAYDDGWRRRRMPSPHILTCGYWQVIVWLRRLFAAVPAAVLAGTPGPLLSQAVPATPSAQGVGREVYEAYEDLSKRLTAKQQYELARLVLSELDASQRGLDPGAQKINPSDGLTYVWVPAGTFMMGCVPTDTECEERERPRHAVTISRGFWMGRVEVTVESFERFVHSTDNIVPPAPEWDPDWKNKDHPIVNVTWEEAAAYCAWAAGRLPSEAEWEYAARGGEEGLKYPWGNRLVDQHANFQDGKWTYSRESGRLIRRTRRPEPGAERSQTMKVASFPPNGFKLYDMVGNAWEWTADFYGEDYYQDSPMLDPPGPAGGPDRVGRGGSWFYSPRFLKLSSRGRFGQTYWSDNLGFRCARDIIP